MCTFVRKRVIKMIKQLKLWIIAAILSLGATHVLYAQPSNIALPKVSIDNLKGTLTKEVPVEATFTINYTDETTGQPREERFRCLVSYRGATSIRFDKKSLKIAFLKQEGDGELDVRLPGLERTSDKYNLDAASIDRSRIRNRMAMDLFNSYSRLPYATDLSGRHGILGTYVEVWTEGRYSGLYCLTDRVNRKLMGGKKVKNGVVRGVVYKCKAFGNGCFLTADGTQPEEGNSAWNAWEVKYPNEYPVEVWKPLQDLMDAPWDTEPDATYVSLVRQHFYWDNLVDLYLLTLMAGVADAGYKNSYLSQPDHTADQRFVITPWDMDHSFGATYCGTPLIDTSTLLGQSNWSKVPPFKRLLQNADFGFLAALADRWAELRDGPLSVESVSHLMFSYADLFDHTDSWQHEHEAWNYNPVTMGTTAHDEAAYMVEWYEANHKALSELLTPYQTDGIEEIEQDPIVNSRSAQGDASHLKKSSNSKWFDLQGRKVANGKLQKGIYINTSTKMLIK